jgi:PAS domain S-box-containing protein
MVVDAKILIVEDEGITALEIQNKVESWGYDVVDVVSSGEDAVKTALEIKPNLILMDIVLKEKLNGIEAAKIIKKSHNIPIIYLTAYGDEKTLQNAKFTIPHAYILKPFEENELKFAIEMALFKHEMETKLMRSEEKYRTLAENAHDIIFIIDLDDNVKYVNNYAAKLLELKPEEVIGKSRKDFFPIDISNNQRVELDKTVQKNTSIRIEGKISFPQCEMWLDTQLIPLKDKNDQTYAVMGISRDITHRRTIEEALRESEEKYREMVENISDVIFMVDKDGQITYISPTIEKITRYKQDELLGNLLSNFVHPEDLDELMDSIEKGGLNRERNPREFRIFDKDGSLKYLRSSGQTVIKNGQILGVTGVFSDITKSKLMEAALKDSEQRLKAVLYGSPIPAFVIDKNHKVLYWNKALEKSSGISADELIGSDEHWKAFYSKKRPCMADILVDDDIESFPNWYNGDCTASESVEDAYQSTDFFPKMGKKGKWLHFTAATIKDSQGNIFGAIETLEDVTERKKAENSMKESEIRFRSVVESSTDAIIIGDQNMNILSWNRGAHEIFRYTEKEIIGQHLTKIILKDHTESYEKISGDNIAILEKPAEMIGLKNDGTQFPIEILLTSWRMGEESFYTAFIRDITLRKVVEGKIKSSLNEKEVLLKEIHHRVKNNMQIISSLISLQSDYADNEDTIKMFEDSKNRIRSMALIHEKLYQSEDISLIDFADYIESLAGRLLEVYGVAGRGINLRINAEDIFLSIDAAIPCGLIINELVSNSIKHAFPNGRLGQITIDMEKHNGGYMLSVSDDGVGFPEDIDYKNTESLGLQIVQTLTSQLRGKIELYVNGGTRFEIIFKE